LRDAFAAAQKRPLLALDTARSRHARVDFTAGKLAKPGFVGVRDLELDLAELANWIDWSPFFHTWEITGRYPALLDDPKKGVEAKKLFADAQALLHTIIADKLLSARATYGFFDAYSEGDDIVVDGGATRFPMLRQQ